MQNNDIIPINTKFQFVLAQESSDADCRSLGMKEIVDERGIVTSGTVSYERFIEIAVDAKAQFIIRRT